MTRAKEVFAESCAVAIRAKAAGKYRSAIRRGKSLVSHSGNGARFPRKQFPVKRQALSINENRNQFRSCIRDQRKSRSRLGQFFLSDLQGISPVDELEFFNPCDETRPSNSNLRIRNLARATIGRLHSLVSGVRHLFYTTTRSVSLPAILPSPVA